MAASIGRPIVVGRGFRVVGARNIAVDHGRLMLGTSFYGFADRRMGGLLRVRGTLHIAGTVTIAHGNRWDIGPGGKVAVGSGSLFSPGTRLVAMTSVTVGERCGIGWDCQFLDDDFHEFVAEGSTPRARFMPITIGNDVWIASGASIYKGTRIGDGCVVAAGSRVGGEFLEGRCLIAGSPARVVKRGVSWRLGPRQASFAYQWRQNDGSGKGEVFDS